MEKGDIVFIEYDAWFADNEELFDTTNEELAKEKEIFDDKRVYAPKPVIIGTDLLVKGLDDSLLQAEVGKDYTVEISPADAYGERDPKLVEIHSRAEIERLPEFRDKDDAVPAPGMQIQMRGKIGYITTVTAGRVRVDFNNRFAGKSLKYNYKIASVPKTPEEKIKAVLGVFYEKEEEFEIRTEDDKAEIKLVDQCKYDVAWFGAKAKIVGALREYVGMNRVLLVEEYLKKVAEEEEPKTEEETGEPEKEEVKD
jgi:FKBP-type peptidyl-prolyl cis-trans isomerase 2